MRVFAVLVAFSAFVIAAHAQDPVREALRVEEAGDAVRAEQLLRAAASRVDAGPEVLEAYAGFLERGNGSLQPIKFIPSLLRLER